MTPSNPAPVGDERAAMLEIIEKLAQQWDACEYDTAGVGLVDIGDAIRRAGFPMVHALSSSTVQQVGAEDARDAARYRVVRSRFGVADMDSYRVTVKPEEIDALIDAAIASSSKSGTEQ